MKKATSNRPNPLKKRDLEGNIIDKSDPDRKPRRYPFDESLWKYINRGSAKAESEISGCIETVVRERIETFVSENDKSIERLLEDAKIHNADVDTVDTLFDIGLDVMLDIYCTRGWKFDAEKFQTAMEKMELRPIHAHNLFSAIEKWRRQCEPVPTSVSSSTIN